MKRVLGHCLAGLSIACLTSAVVSACAHNDSSLFIQDVIYPTPVAAGQGCTFTADPAQVFQSRGTLDVAFRGAYSAMFLVGNQLVVESNSQQLQTETSTITIQGITSRVTDAQGNELDNFTSPTAGTVYPATGTVPGYAAISATIASPKAVTAIKAEKQTLLAMGGSTTMVSYVKFFGHTLGGTSVESNEFAYPIDVCDGCLVRYSAADIATTCEDGRTLNVPNCLGAGTTTSSLPVPCITGQDTPIDCSQCQDFKVCHGAYPNGAPAGCYDAGVGGG